MDKAQKVREDSALCRINVLNVRVKRSAVIQEKYPGKKISQGLSGFQNLVRHTLEI
jgi:hypothetical protein